MTRINRQFFLARRPVGAPTDDDIRYREGPVPEPGPGQVLMRNAYVSLDPAIRDWMSDNVSYAPPIPIGGCIRSTTLGTVIESRHPDFAEGDRVVGLGCNGWEDYSVADGAALSRVEVPAGHPARHELSIFSVAMGITPYFGILARGRPRAGETVLVSAAAGAVGSVAAQIASIQGCRVVGLCGSDEKCAWLTSELGLDDAINYRASSDLTAAIARHCPAGVDIFFDSVGGAILDAALMNLNDRARVVFCGAISTYNHEGPVPGPYNYWQILARGAEVLGLLSLHHREQWPQARSDLARWVEQGQLKFAEHIVDGFENIPASFQLLFRGENRGKLLVRLNNSCE